MKALSRFCSPACAAAAALPGGAHGAELCAALAALRQSSLDAEARPSARSAWLRVGTHKFRVASATVTTGAASCAVFVAAVQPEGRKRQLPAGGGATCKCASARAFH